MAVDGGDAVAGAGAAAVAAAAEHSRADPGKSHSRRHSSSHRSGGVVHGLCGAFKGFECVCAAKAKARQMQIEMKRNYKIIENYRR